MPRRPIVKLPVSRQLPDPADGGPVQAGEPAPWSASAQPLHVLRAAVGVAAAHEPRQSWLRRYRSAVLAGVLTVGLCGSAASTPASDPGAAPAVPSTPLAPAVAESLLEQIDSADAQASAGADTTASLGVPEAVRRAIGQATGVVGVDAGYLTAVAARESRFNPARRAQGTTAAGLYQFTEDTWLRAVKVFGAKHGLGEYARQIVVDDDGGLAMARPAARARLLQLRNDALLSALMAAELARDNKGRLERLLGRRVTPAETYLAHLLGVTQAARIIDAARSAPRTPGAQLLPAAARYNPGVFSPAGQAASAGAIVAAIEAYFAREVPRFAGI